MNSSDVALMGFRAMAADDLSGGAITYGGSDYPASIGVFQQYQDLMVGGRSPYLMATLIVAREDFTNPAFASDQELTVTPNIGPARDCKIKQVRDMGAVIELDVIDKNQGA